MALNRAPAFQLAASVVSQAPTCLPGYCSPGIIAAEASCSGREQQQPLWQHPFAQDPQGHCWGPRGTRPFRTFSSKPFAHERRIEQGPQGIELVNGLFDGDEGAFVLFSFA